MPRARAFTPLPPCPSADSARSAGAFNALLGRPRRGSVDSAIRCVAATALPPSTVILCDLPGALASGIDRVPAAPAAPGDRVRVVNIRGERAGELNGRLGTVVRLREQPDGSERPVVRVDGKTDKLIVLPRAKLEVVEVEEEGADLDADEPTYRTAIL